MIITNKIFNSFFLKIIIYFFSKSLNLEIKIQFKKRPMHRWPRRPPVQKSKTNFDIFYTAVSRGNINKAQPKQLCVCLHSSRKLQYTLFVNKAYEGSWKIFLESWGKRLFIVQVRIRNDCILYLTLTPSETGRGVLGGALPPAFPTRGGGALLILHLLAFPSLRQSSFYILLHLPSSKLKD